MIFDKGVTYRTTTTTCSIELGKGEVGAPWVVLPDEDGTWELINSNAVATSGQIFFFWFWRKKQELQQEGLDQ